MAGYDATFRVVAARDGSTFTADFGAVPCWDTIELDEDAASVRVPDGVELDLGATAKALACDRAAAAAAAVAGGVLVGLGGDISVAGETPTGGWPVRIADDHAAPLDGPGPTVALSGGGLATSSTTVRRWYSGATELHHLVDPRTGRPAESQWRTVSVAAASCVDANVASTASFMLADAPAWLAERQLPARLVSIDGAATCVGGWPEDDA
jgi:thiamine biosynthesis lipoprotein